MSMPRIERLRPMTFLLLLLAALSLHAAPWRTASAETAGEVLELCRMAGGGGGVENAGINCCWPDWGCMHCATDTQGNVIEGSCRMSCRTAACAEANDTLTPGDPALPPSVKRPDVFNDLLAPPKNPQTPKPLKVDPGTNTVQ